MAPLTAHYFSDATHLTEFMDRIFHMLHVDSHQNNQVFKVTLEGLIDIVRINYHVMGGYLEKLLQMT